MTYEKGGILSLVNCSDPQTGVKRGRGRELNSATEGKKKRKSEGLRILASVDGNKRRRLETAVLE
jgi:hypothetical protein